MDVRIEKCNISGKINVPPSKSMAHRLLMAAALSVKPVTIHNIEYSNDILATLSCLESLGYEFVKEENAVTFTSVKRITLATLNAKESGSTLRFLIPLALTEEGTYTFTGTKKLFSRGIDIYYPIFEKNKIHYELTEDSLTVTGKLKAGEYEIKGNISSQYLTGLLFSLPLVEGKSILKVLPPLESKPYVNLTLDVLKDAGIKIKKNNDLEYEINGKEQYKLKTMNVEGDYSNSAYFAAMNILGNNLELIGLKENSLQGDKIYEEYFPALKQGTVSLDIRNCIDLGPILFTLAGLLHGATFTGTKRLKIKESNRIGDVKTELSKLGIAVIEEENSVTIDVKNRILKDTIFESHNDHRIVMSCAVLCMVCGGTIKDVDPVKKSFPSFFKVLEELGVKMIYD